MIVPQSKAVELLVSIGFKTAHEWDVGRLLDRFHRVTASVNPEELDLPGPQSILFQKIQTALTTNESLIIDEDEIEPEKKDGITENDMVGDAGVSTSSMVHGNNESKSDSNHKHSTTHTPSDSSIDKSSSDKNKTNTEINVVGVKKTKTKKKEKIFRNIKRFTRPQSVVVVLQELKLEEILTKEKLYILANDMYIKRGGRDNIQESECICNHILDAMHFLGFVLYSKKGRIKRNPKIPIPMKG
jgi:hypothetical protein